MRRPVPGPAGGVAGGGQAGDRAAYAARLARAIRFRTVSHPDPGRADPEPFLAFHGFLAETFPRTHRRLTREVVAGLSLLYTWEGSDPPARPLVLTAHMDVVPVEPGTEASWRHPPFDGAVADGFVWGRGTMDCKGILMAILQAVEELLAAGFRPRRTVYLGFGHDEEVGGRGGALEIASLLAARGVGAEFVLDEGGAVVTGGVPGVRRPLATVGIAEKGYLSLKLSARGPGGHSSMPPRQTAVGALARAVKRLERRPFPARLGEAGRATLAGIAPLLPFYLRPACAHGRALSLPLALLLSRVENLAPLVRTTTAVTRLEAGARENLVPQEACAVVNHRLLPGDTVDGALRETRRAVNDPRVRVDILGSPCEASPVSPVDTGAFRTLQRAIAEVFADAVPLPILLPGMSDARHYAAVSDCIFRFGPQRVSPEDRARVHGTDERVSVENYGEFVAFYRALLRQAAGAAVAAAAGS